MAIHDRPRKGALPSSVESIGNLGRCGVKGCLDPGLSLKDTYTVDTVGSQTGLRIQHSCRDWQVRELPQVGARDRAVICV